jgi:cytochrome oxidase Cu insertion factor (SCO1/SenC/PrrC family)
MADIQILVGEAEDVQLFSLTVDPRNDTPAALNFVLPTASTPTLIADFS